MIKFDHLRIPVSDLARSRDWYIRTLGLTVEESPSLTAPASPTGATVPSSPVLTAT